MTNQTPVMVRTASGLDVPVCTIRPHHVRFCDIAHQLSAINLFRGATLLPYSCAQHGLVVAAILEAGGANASMQLAGLLSRAHEAYQDLNQMTPAVRRLDLSQRIQNAVYTAAGLTDGPWWQPGALAMADKVAMAGVWRDLMTGPAPAHVSNVCPPFGIRPMRHDIAHETFASTYRVLADLSGTSPLKGFDNGQ